MLTCWGLQYSRRVGQAQREHSRTSADQISVRVSVIAPRKLQDLIPLGIGPHQSQNRETGLGTRVDKSHHLYRGYSVDHHLSQLVLQLTGRAKTGTLVQLGMQSLDDLVVGMPTNGRTPGTHVVDVLVAVHVKHVRPLHVVEDDGSTSYRLKSPGMSWNSVSVALNSNRLYIPTSPYRS